MTVPKDSQPVADRRSPAQRIEAFNAARRLNNNIGVSCDIAGISRRSGSRYEAMRLETEKAREREVDSTPPLDMAGIDRALDRCISNASLQVLPQAIACKLRILEAQGKLGHFDHTANIPATTRTWITSEAHRLDGDNANAPTRSPNRPEVGVVQSASQNSIKPGGCDSDGI